MTEDKLEKTSKEENVSEKEIVEETEERGRGQKDWKERKAEEKAEEELKAWKPKTKVGLLVKEGKIKNIDEVLDKYNVLEPEIPDSLLKLKSEFLNIGQSKGKFGGGKRRIWRQTQRKTAEGNAPTFSCLAVVGDEKGHVGIGLGKSQETLPARGKAIRKAKLSLIKVIRGCGSFDCSCNEEHSLPFIVEGKCASSKVVLIPAPQGTGLVIGDECKKILRLVGIKDVYSKTFGQTRTTINVAKACISALKKTTEMVRREG